MKRCPCGCMVSDKSVCSGCGKLNETRTDEGFDLLGKVGPRPRPKRVGRVDPLVLDDKSTCADGAPEAEGSDDDGEWV